MNRPINIDPGQSTDLNKEIASLTAQIEGLKAEEQALVLRGASGAIERFRAVISERLTLEHQLMMAGGH